MDSSKKTRTTVARCEWHEWCAQECTGMKCIYIVIFRCISKLLVRILIRINKWRNNVLDSYLSIYFTSGFPEVYRRCPERFFSVQYTYVVLDRDIFDIPYNITYTIPSSALIDGI